MRFLAEGAFHASGQPDTGFAEFVAQFVGGGHGLLPTLVTAVIQQIHLAGGCVFER